MATATRTLLKKWRRAASNFIALIPPRSIRKILTIFFLELNSKRLYQSSEKDEESRCLLFTSSTKGEITHFHVVVVQWRQRNVQKNVMHVQSCCFARLNPLLLCRSRWRRRRRCLSSPLTSLVPRAHAKAVFLPNRNLAPEPLGKNSTLLSKHHCLLENSLGANALVKTELFYTELLILKMNLRKKQACSAKCVFLLSLDSTNS